MLKFVISLLIISQALSQNKLLIDDIQGKGLIVKYLDIESEQNIELRIVSPEYYENTNSPAYVWILNSKTREVVWELEEAEYTSYSSRLNEYEDEVSLVKGLYEIHFATYMNRNFNGNIQVNKLKDIFKVFSNGFSGERIRRRDLEDMSLEIRYEDGKEITSKREIKKYQFEGNKKPFYSFTRVTDDEYEVFGFKTDDDIEVSIYAIGEIERDEEYDFAMIKDLKSGEIIWKMDYYNSDYAGGGKKNRRYSESIKLDEGLYALYYITDDSHSYHEWNQGSSYDPNFYGITLFVDEDDMDEIEEINVDEHLNKNRVLALTKLRDDTYIKQPIKLNKDLKLRIYALGEGTSYMSDYSWITDLKTGKKVWEFKYRDSQHAGGSEKNRLIDEIIHLEEGEYVVYAKTDDSHAYREWNANKPNDREAWGISLFIMNDDYDEDDFETFKLSDKRDVIAEITRVQDDEKIRERFNIEDKMTVHIYAQGEGQGREMYDFGWIVDDSGRTVWKMKYRDTEHGGGASKNRKFEGTIELKPGKYYLYYRTDDSHSYEDWNMDEPMDPKNWGIILYTLK